ncbi:hypothetical protein RHGRI_010518 [Rhododendron griersonianum]|uniref:Uncharacterized protein n=1 Tax=Rhododendron griersonianum TaxID=479676 RepID=A0AAV6KJP5_9ERIC|nr:hypothetical protein RHGRI_010518 [Rhododendron griersonianum]
MNSRNKKIWAVGPLNHGKKSESNSRHKCLEWLDKQVPKSVLYVSFGTTTSMTDEQIKELAMGLEQSKQKFIWILRDADKGDNFAGDVKRAQLPEGIHALQMLESRVVKRLMASNEGEEMGKRAEEIGAAVQLAVEEGGVSRLELDSFIAHITR